MEEIDEKPASLTELHERPAGTVRITSSAHAARAVLWPVIDRVAAENPDINVEISLESGLVDIVSGRFDAGVRLGERLDQDMIAVPISPRPRMAAFAAPSFLERHATPQSSYDLAKHNCTSLRMATSGGLYAWKFGGDSKEIKVKTEGQLVFNDVDLIVAAALAGRGIAFTVKAMLATTLPPAPCTFWHCSTSPDPGEYGVRCRDRHMMK